jgi:hypothetical protein
MGGLAMDIATIGHLHTRAICDEIGERLRTLLSSTAPDDKAEFEDKLDQLSAIEAKTELR